MNRFAIRVLGAAGLFLFGIAAGAAGQSQSQPQSSSQPQEAKQNNAASAPTGKTKTKRVWTDDDLPAIRKPSDLQEDQDAEAKQREDAAAAETAAKMNAQASAAAALRTKLSDNAPLPTTFDEAEQKISVRQQEKDYITEELEATKQNYDSASEDEQRSRLKVTIDLLEDELREANDDLKLLQARLEALKKASKASQAVSSASAQSNPEAGNPQN
jgi:hypothetical protein